MPERAVAGKHAGGVRQKVTADRPEPAQTTRQDAHHQISLRAETIEACAARLSQVLRDTVVETSGPL
jgi:hypothetical protein